MADLDESWSGDLAWDDTGDLLMIDGVDLDNQHIVRRLFTRLGGVAFHLSYGAGIPQRIGRPARIKAIQAIVRSQLALEATVASIPVPTIDVDFPSDNPGMCTIAITYTNAISNVKTSIALEVPTGR